MDHQDNNEKETTIAQVKMSNGESTVCDSGGLFSGAQSFGAPGKVVQDFEATLLRQHASMKRNGHLFAFQVAYHRARNDHNQANCGRVLQHDMKCHCATVAPVAYYRDNSTNTDTSVIQKQRVSYGSSQVQQFGAGAKPGNFISAM
jgi:hypothetical protein